MDDSDERRQQKTATDERNRERDQRSHDAYQRRRQQLERRTEQHERLEWEGPRNPSEPDDAQGNEGPQ